MLKLILRLNLRPVTNKPFSFGPLDTPCVGICSTIYGDDICRGCFRSCQDVIDWNTYQDSKKRAILQALNQGIVAVLQDKMDITDVDLLHKKCTQFQVKIHPDWHPLTWAHALMREGIHRIHNLNKYGIRVKPAYATLRLPDLIERIDDEIFHAAHCPL